MFKLTKGSGRRNASPTPQSSRISGLSGLRGSDISLSQRRKPAFVPNMPQEQGFDSNTPRVDETA